MGEMEQLGTKAKDFFVYLLLKNTSIFLFFIMLPSLVMLMAVIIKGNAAQKRHYHGR